MTTPSLSQILQTGDSMLLIDDLHAFEFDFDPAQGLKIECMDGRALKRWSFTPAQIEAARLDGETWLIQSDAGEHRLVCLNAFSASEDDEGEDENA
ncbi:DUF5629 family protein [Pseudomonas sp. R5(2019)]|uniref:DUF5629 family protein n=1 Tax=Pseudomonas sp. R5(2019) TaxID=2697566 RepID=UPI0014125187|nr:DUF5629 family protein [Pseudomonas sp. R5(2019)]NBA94301.1 hypothetical protein [Pseudomonas sp. R5(2019)]